jgi:hypothetical protein
MHEFSIHRRKDGSAELTCGLTHSLSLTTPAQRMVVVEEVEFDGTTERWILPVLALQASVVYTYRKHRKADDYRVDPEYRTHREMVQHGWVFAGDNICYSALIMDEEFGLIAHNHTLMEASNVHLTLVICDWPESEDEARLQGVRQPSRLPEPVSPDQALRPKNIGPSAKNGQ